MPPVGLVTIGDGFTGVDEVAAPGGGFAEVDGVATPGGGFAEVDGVATPGGGRLVVAMGCTGCRTTSGVGG